MPSCLVHWPIWTQQAVKGCIFLDILVMFNEHMKNAAGVSMVNYHTATLFPSYQMQIPRISRYIQFMNHILIRMNSHMLLSSIFLASILLKLEYKTTLGLERGNKTTQLNYR